MQSFCRVLITVFFFSSLTVLALSFQYPDQKQKNDEKENFIELLLKGQPEKFSGILASPEFYRMQIIYTQINRDSDNIPHFKQYSYRAIPQEYFNPASLVKIPAAALSLQKLNELNIPGLNKYSRMKIDSAFYCQTPVTVDSTAADGYPSIAHYIKKAIVVSDNEAYNRLYEFCGQEYLNKKLWEMGYATARITSRFAFNCDTLSNHYTNPMIFYDLSGQIIYQQPLVFSRNHYENFFGKIFLGTGYMDNRTGKQVNHPKNFTYSNILSLRDITEIFQSVIFPESFPEQKKFKLTEDDYRFLYQYFSMYPRESMFPRYDTVVYHDSFKKYLFYGARDSMIHSSIRIFNHVGQAYGFMADCAYFVDFENKVEFFLSAVIYVNKDGILNDGKYEYEEIAAPFFANLGKLFYEYELKRNKKFLPDLSRFKMDYSK